MQDKIILGLLAYQDASLYDLKKTMEQSTVMFYNTSIGSIHPALQKLERQKYVTVREEANGKRIKKVYRRTQAGVEAFQSWISEPIAVFKTKDESMLRLFYFGHIEGDVSQHIQLYIDEADHWIAMLEAMLAAQDLSKVPKSHRKIAFFQLATMRYGLDTIKFGKQWYKQLLTDYQQQQFD
ncbi:PadR family transcriptional regulator [Maritalea sp.]|uniref:PadR family transcriptional regulator n=1 Tax=Maritalea sp. TaxID=2003361 RepID=UPI003EF46EE0